MSRPGKQFKGHNRNNKRQNLKFATRALDPQRGRGRGDHDGDVSMFESIRNKRRARNWSNRQAYTLTDSTKVMISNVPRTSPLKEVINFLNSKSPLPITVLDCSVNDNGKVFLVVESPEQAIALIKLSNTIFMSNRLKIKGIPMKNGPSILTRHLSQLVTNCYDEQRKFLDLSNVALTLNNMNTTSTTSTMDFSANNTSNNHTNINIKIDFNQITTIKSLCHLIKQKCPLVETISFANNEISTLQGFKDFWQAELPIVNLSFESNKIAEISEIDHLKNLKLKELVLTGNPLLATLDSHSYQSQILTRFPNLKLLDTQEIKPLIQFNGPSSIPRPQEFPAYFDSEINRIFATNFVERFLSLWDNKREDLLQLYSDRSFFSLTCAADTILTTKPVPNHSIQRYVPYCHNLLRLKDVDKRETLIYQGGINIINSMLQLPASNHKSFTIIEAFAQTQNVLSVYLQGTFIECDSGTERSFVRLLLLTTADPKATQTGWLAVITNDMLHLRNVDSKEQIRS